MLTASYVLWRTVDSEQRRRLTSASYMAAASNRKMRGRLRAQPEIDGFLVGRASLDSELRIARQRLN
jgi:triosephosphate isomerase